jgi:aryl-alcohol dehydrogenase-like predicted oxidoreductase
LTQLEENIRATEIRLSDELIAAVNEIHAQGANPAQ